MVPSFIGHDDVRAALCGVADADRLPHALLFTGPVGVGKSLVARYLAARLLCVAPTARPCGLCARCVQLGAGTHPDFTTIGLAAGKKEIGVDAIRQLKRLMALRAASSYKVAIIDDADRLSIAAQNALLKTLEEPPAGSFLILVTASARALLPTVRSRCRHVTFRPLTPTQVEAVLQETAGVPAEEARELARAAEGSPGYALQLRDVLAAAVTSDLRRLLADLSPDRYVTVARLAKTLGRSEQEMMTRLQVLFALCHEDAVRGAHLSSQPVEDGATADALRVTRQAAAVARAIAALQRRNPNRPLLAEALALQLARS